MPEGADRDVMEARRETLERTLEDLTARAELLAVGRGGDLSGGGSPGAGEDPQASR